MGAHGASYGRRLRIRSGRLKETGSARTLAAALEEQPLSRREVVVAVGLLGVVAAAVLGPYITRGGFYTDDWVLASWAKYPAHGGIAGLFHQFDAVRYRPGIYVYAPIAYSIFGLHMGAFLAWTALCAVAMSSAFFVFLRFFRVGRLEAFLAAALALVYPYSSSTRLWSGLSAMSLTITLYLVGTLLVLRALSRPSRHAVLLHVAGTAVVVASVMTYEIVAPAVLLSVLLYSRVTTWRRAALAWLIDVVLVGATLVFITSGRAQPVGGIRAELDHAWLIAQQGADLWARSLVPYGTVPTRLAVGGLIALACIAAVVAGALPRSNPARSELLRWLGFLGAATLATCVAYAMFVPADLYYSPYSLGIGDRTNGFASLGWAFMVVAFARLLAVLVFRDITHSRLAVAAGVALVGLLVGLGYSDRLRSEADAYAQSYRDQTDVIATMQQTLPDPPHGSTIFLVNSIPWTSPGVPVFVQPWDLVGTVKLIYRDGTLAGYPLAAPYATMRCGSRTVGVTPASFGPPVRYGRAFVLSMATRTTVALVDRRSCLSAATAAGLAPAAS